MSSEEQIPASLIDLLHKNNLCIVDVETLNIIADSTLYCISVPGANAIELWKQLRQEVDITGYWPVIIGGENTDDIYETFMEDPTYAPLETIQKASEINLKDWINEAREDEDPDMPGAPHGQWPNNVKPSSGFTVHTDILSGNPFDTVDIVFMPTTRPWEAAAYLNYGGWNDCPLPDVQVAFAKSWHERFGAEPIGFTNSAIEFMVARPPATRDDALTLAFEQYAYCYDIVDQGVETIERLAAILINGASWYFWWD